MKTGQDVDDLIMGMASQIAEREDNIVVEDLRGASIRNNTHQSERLGHILIFVPLV